MKSLLFGLVLIVLLGTAGFFYRNVMETSGTPEPVACTMDAKVCPDGSAVGRTGPACAFAACPEGNAEYPNLGLGLVIPQGYVENKDALGDDVTLIAAFEKKSPTEQVPHAVVVRAFSIPEGKTAEEVIIAETIFEPSDMGADSIEDFTQETIGGRSYYTAVVERFEAQIHSLYYLPRATDVLRFEVLERDVMDWMEPDLVVGTLPEHAAFREMLRTLTVTQ